MRCAFFERLRPFLVLKLTPLLSPFHRAFVGPVMWRVSLPFLLIGARPPRRNCRISLPHWNVTSPYPPQGCDCFILRTTELSYRFLLRRPISPRTLAPHGSTSSGMTLLHVQASLGLGSRGAQSNVCPFPPQSRLTLSHALCETACRNDPSRAFAMGPSCILSCGSVWVRWHTPSSWVGLRCSTSRQMVVRAAQRLDIATGLIILQFASY